MLNEHQIPTSPSSLKRIHILNIIVYLLLLIISLFFRKAVVIGIATGGAISVLNFFFLQTLITRAFSKETNLGLKLFFYFIKLAALLSLIYVCIVYAPLDKGAFVIGLSILFISVICNSIIENVVRRKR